MKHLTILGLLIVGLLSSSACTSISSKAKSIGRQAIQTALNTAEQLQQLPGMQKYPHLSAVETEELPKLMSIAEQLGYQPELQIRRSRHCSPMFVAPYIMKCNIFLAYETEMSVSNITSLIDKLNMEQTHFFQANDRRLLPYLNFYIMRTIEVPQPELTLKEGVNILGSLREFHIADNQLLVIDIYETNSLNPSMMLGERSIQKNIVVITLDIGVVIFD